MATVIASIDNGVNDMVNTAFDFYFKILNISHKVSVQ